jgi:DNA mismatch endonuclease (patch repair protein)
MSMRPSSPEVSERMSKVRNKDTAAEMAIRSELHRRGYRYRVNLSVPEAGRSRPDIAFTKRRIAVFVDGCFWHKCPEHATSPRSNEQWWATKLDVNVRRDRSIDRALREAGWTVLRVWEHERPSVAVDKIIAAVNRWTRDSVDGG